MTSAPSGRNQSERTDGLQQNQLSELVADAAPQRVGCQRAGGLRTQQDSHIRHAQAKARRGDDKKRQGHQRGAAQPLRVQEQAEPCIGFQGRQTVL